MTANGPDRDTEDAEEGEPESITDDEALPEDVREQATRLTRHARTTGDPAATERYRAERRALLAEYDYTARVREADATLVLHPEAWIDDGTVQPGCIDDTDDAVEVPLDGPDDDWAVVDRHNRRVVERVGAEYEEVHAATVSALADYAGNHHESRIEHLSDQQLERFREEYFPRNAWPNEEQWAVLEEAVAIARELSEELDS